VIYYVEQANDRIMECNMDGSDPQVVLNVGNHVVTGLQVDNSGGRMYWEEPNEGAVCSAKLNGTDVTTLVSGLPDARDAALDPANNVMYVTAPTAPGGGLVLRVPMSGGPATTILNTGGNPFGITLDSGKLYWADWYYLHSYIYSANMDGTGGQPLTDVLQMHILQNVTSSGDWVYFGGSASASATNADSIYEIRTDGTGLAKLCSTVNPWGMAVFNNTLYWAEQNAPLSSQNGGSIQCVSLDGGPVQTLLVDSADPFGIAIVDTSAIPEPLTISILFCAVPIMVRRRQR
jgi:hypothetical protein